MGEKESEGHQNIRKKEGQIKTFMPEELSPRMLKIKEKQMSNRLCTHRSTLKSHVVIISYVKSIEFKLTSIRRRGKKKGCQSSRRWRIKEKIILDRLVVLESGVEPNNPNLDLNDPP